VAVTLSLAAFIEARRKQAIARGNVARLGTQLAGGISWFLLATGLMGLTVGLVAPNWLLGIAGGVVTATGGVLLRRVFQRTRTR
jgi:hypothetical protein